MSLLCRFHPACPSPLPSQGNANSLPIQTQTGMLQAISSGAPHASSDIYGQASRSAQQNNTLGVAKATDQTHACLLLKYWPRKEVSTVCSSQCRSKQAWVSSHATATVWMHRTCSSTLRHSLGCTWTSSCPDLECRAALDIHSKCRKTWMGLQRLCLMWKERFRNKTTPLIAVGWVPVLVQHPWRGAGDRSSQHHSGNGDFESCG